MLTRIMFGLLKPKLLMDSIYASKSRII